MPSKLQTDYPWAQTPIIINAPMAGFAESPLATAVTLAGGIGTIGAVEDMSALEARLQSASETITSSSPPSSPALKFYQETSLLPLGIGLLLFIVSPTTVLPVLKRHPPAFIWLFAAPTLSDYTTWTAALRAELPATKIWIQVGSASAAAEVARAANPDVLVLQGSDAGGHGFVRGAGIVSLVPETKALLSTATTPDMPPLVAAGGLSTGASCAAALALGAEGVVLGTRFLAARETTIHPAYLAAVLAARNGAEATVRAPVFDELRGPSIWPAGYDGRALATESYKEWVAGVGVELIRERYGEAVEGVDRGYGSRAAVWAGAGVGLVNEVLSAKEIVEELREGAKKALRETLAAI